MVVVILSTIFFGVLVYKRIKKRRARKRAMKSAAVNSPVVPSSPPPYSTPSTHPHEPSEGPPHLMVPGSEYPGTYVRVRDKPPSYSAPVPQVQKS